MGDVLPQIVLVGARADGTYNYDDLVELSAARDLLPTAVGKRFRLSFTGGTTGSPKAVVQTHRQEIAMVRNLLLEAIRPEQQSVFVHSMPIAHASGSFILPVVLGGGTMAWTDGFLPDRLVHSAWLGDTGLRIQTFLVPTALGDLSGAIGPSGHDLDTVIYGGAPCPRAVLEQAVERIGLRLTEVYGQAEAPMTICVLPARDHADPGSVVGCIGYPFMFVDIRIGEGGSLTARPGAVGELVVRAEHVMEGYWKNPEATAEKLLPDGSLRTQDMGYCDEQGRFWLSGRTRDMIISGGYNVFPAEVERRLGNIEGISQLLVIGAPHPRWGESLVAVVVPDSDIFDESRLILQVEGVSKSQLAEYERPKRVVFLRNLPTTSLGKVARTELELRLRGIFTSEPTQ
jgi:acyl-CoA synthetase (AMP-forming)/AMP-acid ligase II